MLCLGALAAAQQTAEDWYHSGMRLFGERQPEQALTAFRRAVELSPDHAKAWAAIGVVFAARHDYTAAEAPFHRACTLNPALPDACLYYGRILYLEDRFDDALPVLQNAAAREPKNPEIYRIEALCLEAMGRAQDAEEQFRRAVGLAQQVKAAEDPAVDYGVFLYRAGRTEEALGPLQAAVDRDAKSARAQLELGCALLALGRAEDAAWHLERAVALNPAAPRAHLLLGKAYQRLGKIDAAQRELAQGSRTVK
jgi:Flp pilus assembly protein TadD